MYYMTSFFFNFIFLGNNRESITNLFSQLKNLITRVHDLFFKLLIQTVLINAYILVDLIFRYCPEVRFYKLLMGYVHKYFSNKTHQNT